MMGRLEREFRINIFYNFCLDDIVPSDHLLRRIDAVLKLDLCDHTNHYAPLREPASHCYSQRIPCRPPPCNAIET